MSRTLERLTILVLALLLASGPIAQGSAFTGGRAIVTALGGIAFALWLASMALRPTRLAGQPKHRSLPLQAPSNEGFSLAREGEERSVHVVALVPGSLTLDVSVAER
jgi:hypothetical protein